MRWICWLLISDVKARAMRWHVEEIQPWFLTRIDNRWCTVYIFMCIYTCAVHFGCWKSPRSVCMLQVVLHFNRGTSDPDGDGNFDCIPAVDNFQVFHFFWQLSGFPFFWQLPGFPFFFDNFQLFQYFSSLLTTWQILSRSSRQTLGRLGAQCRTYHPSSNSRTESSTPPPKCWLSRYRGLLPGPGTGAYIPDKDRFNQLIRTKYFDILTRTSLTNNWPEQTILTF